MARRSKGSRGKVVSVDFTGVESGGRRVPPGEYVVEVEKVEQAESKKSGKPYLSWELKIAEGDFKGSKLFHNTSLQKQSLWTLRLMLEALGIEVDGPMELDLASYRGLRCGVEVDQEDYEGKLRPRVVEVFPLDDLLDEDEEEDEEESDEETDDEEEEEQPAPRRRQRRARR